MSARSACRDRSIIRRRRSLLTGRMDHHKPAAIINLQNEEKIHFVSLWHVSSTKCVLCGPAILRNGPPRADDLNQGISLGIFAMVSEQALTLSRRHLLRGHQDVKYARQR